MQEPKYLNCEQRNKFGTIQVGRIMSEYFDRNVNANLKDKDYRLWYKTR